MHEHEPAVIEKISGLVGLVPRADAVEMLLEREGFEPQQRGDGVEIRADERLHVVTQRVDLEVAAIIRLHFREPAEVEPVLLVSFGRVPEPSL